MSKELYNEKDIIVMENTKDSINKSRLEELINFIKVSGYTHIGIANCLSMQKYADKIKHMLEENGVKVYDVNCKESKLFYADLLGDKNIKGMSCDPASQAKYLNEKNTELNINIGLCLGHGIVFNKYSKAPVTTLIVKDFATNHKTVEELDN